MVALTPTELAVSLSALSVAALVLTVVVFLRYREEHRRCHLYWGVGLFLVFVTVAEEVPLALGVWNQPLIVSYLVLVALLVGILSMGSAELALSGLWKSVWFGFLGVSSAALVVVSVIPSLSTVSSSIVANGVVTGTPPFWVEVLSSLITIPAALMLIGTSLYGAVWQHRWSLLYITAGTVVISAAGALYVFVGFPASLYYAEFVGFVLFFFGFVKIPYISAPAARSAPAQSA